MYQNSSDKCLDFEWGLSYFAVVQRKTSLTVQSEVCEADLESMLGELESVKQQKAKNSKHGTSEPLITKAFIMLQKHWKTR